MQNYETLYLHIFFNHDQALCSFLIKDEITKAIPTHKIILVTVYFQADYMNQFNFPPKYKLGQKQ